MRLLIGAFCRPAGVAIAFGGTIGRAENRRLRELCVPDAVPVESVDADRIDRWAVVDAQPGNGHLSLPAGARIEAVIDHHPARPGAFPAGVRLIESDVGASSTIVWRHLVLAGIGIDRLTATAMLYGIRTDTGDLGAAAGGDDLAAHTDLLGRFDPDLLHEVVTASLSPDYFRAFERALRSGAVAGRSCIVVLEEIESADYLPELADWLVRREGVTCCLVIGAASGRLHLSARTTDRGLDIGAAMQAVTRGLGSGGGHSRMAGGQVGPVPADRTAFNRLCARLVRRWLTQVEGGERDFSAIV